MASGDEHDNDGLQGDDPGAIKKRRLYGACDMCRKKKIRCDSAVMPSNTCSNCIAFGYDCSHTPRRTKAQEREYQRDHYIRTLEDRLSKLEQALHSNNYPAAELANPLQKSNSPPGDPLQAFYDPSLNVPSPNSLTHSSPSPEADTKDEPHGFFCDGLRDRFHQMSIGPLANRFFGRSSPFVLVKHAEEVKKEITGDETSFSGYASMRPLYWRFLPWEETYVNADSAINYDWPEADLMHQLIDLYFNDFHIFIPLLHRPTFEKLVRQNLHRRDPTFGACLLLVCAIGSRSSEDPRVLLEEEINTGTRLSSGWKYFCQVPLLPKYLLSRVGQYDLQFYGLAVMYLFGSGISHVSWNLLGIGIRLALERGLHKQRKDDQRPTVDGELSRRAFWCIVNMDRMMSSFSGRPLGLHEEDFDIELPAECDDEYWEVDDDGHVSFNQPPGKPSKMTGFITYVKLTEMLAYTMRTLYSSKKSHVATHRSHDEWEQQIVAEIDSAMNRWKDSLPDHLRWDPHCEDRVTFKQSSAIHALYYQVQIQVHRPFLQKQTPLSFPSIIICASAARSCSHLLEVQMKRNAYFLPQATMSAFITGIILFLNLLGGKRTGVAAAPEKSLADLNHCLQILKRLETKWHNAGRLWDVLHELVTMRGEFEIASPDPKLSRKRPLRSRTPNIANAPNVAITSNPGSPPMIYPTLYTQDLSNLPPGDWVPDGSYVSQGVTGEGSGLSDGSDQTPGLFDGSDDRIFLTSPNTDISDIAVDNDTMPTWLSVPMNFTINDWEFFISSMAEVGQDTSPAIYGF